MLKKSPFNVGPLLGEGLNANVYRAVSRSSEYGVEQTYALKVLKRKGDLKHFKKEFDVLSEATGPHLVKLYGWQDYNRKPALLLEYIDGVNLERLLEERKLSFEESNWIYHETIAGLLELNSHDLYHGDLSPKNIMVSKNGSVKLIDFGLTKWRTKQIEVTPEFASPEVLQGDLPSFKHDFYSLNKIFNSFSLQRAEKAPSSPPESLCEKVESIQVDDGQTPLYVRKTKPNSRLQLKLFVLFFASLAFFKPVSATNRVFNKSSLHIRSTNWLSVRLSQNSGWCFTPCELKVPSIGQHKIYWKSQNSTGSTHIYVKRDGQTLLMNFK